MGLSDVPVPSLLNNRWVRENDWLATRIDKWVSRCQGYNKLQRVNYSKSQDDEDDRSNWNHPLMRSNINETQNSYHIAENNKTISSNPRFCEQSEEINEFLNQHTARISSNSKRTCNQNLESEMTIDNYENINGNIEMNENWQVYTPISQNQIRIAVNNKVISSIDLEHYGNNANCTCTRVSPKCNCNCENYKTVSSDEDCANENDSHLDRHRKLIQIMATPIRKLGKHIVPEIERGNKEFQHPISEVTAWRQASKELRSFLSFRHHPDSKIHRRKRHVVVGGVGTNDPVWPSVLLTFERGISTRPDSPHSLLASHANK